MVYKAEQLNGFVDGIVDVSQRWGYLSLATKLLKQETDSCSL